MSQANVSPDLIWQITRGYNAYLVKRNSGGGLQLSRDPLNLTNLHSRKYAGYVNEKAIGIQPSEKGGVVITTKKTLGEQHRPASHFNKTGLHGGKSGPRVYRAVANEAARSGYRPDLREKAVTRASRIRQSAKAKRDTPEVKLRGAKARQA